MSEYNSQIHILLSEVEINVDVEGGGGGGGGGGRGMCLKGLRDWEWEKQDIIGLIFM